MVIKLNKNKAIGVSVIVILGMILLFQNLLGDYFLNNNNESELSELKKKVISLKKLQSKVNHLRNERFYLTQNKKEYWIEDRDGALGGQIHQILNKICKESDVPILNIGALTKKNLSDNIDVNSISITTKFISVEKLTTLLYLLSRSIPKLNWNKCNISSNKSHEVKMSGILDFYTLNFKKEL